MVVLVSLKENLDKLNADKRPHSRAERKPAGAAKKTKKAAPKGNGKQPVIKIDRVRFCKELIKHSMNATAAYLEVSPNASRKSAAVCGGRLLREVSTVKLLAPMLSKLFKDAGIEADYVFRRWLEMAEGTASDYFTFDGGVPRLDMSDMTPAQKRNLKKITITPGKFGTTYGIEVYDAQRAVSEIAKHLGLLVDRLAEEDVERIGDLIEQGVKRIRATKDLDGWKDIELDAEYTEVR